MTADARAACRSCGRQNEIKVWTLVNVGSDPSLKEKVRDGSLFVWECPACGTLNLVRSQTLYHDPAQKLMLWLLPEGAVSDSEHQALEKLMKAVAGQGGLEDYVLRRVPDVGSLIEKVNIFDAGLDDVAVEMCKYVTSLEMAEKSKAQLDNSTIKFFRMLGADNEMEFSYPQDGQMHGLRIGFNVYEDCCAILSRNPSIAPAPGFAKVDAAWLATLVR